MSSLPFTEFTADGFRGLRSLEVKDLRGINVFVGGNNSGKTSVLEVLALLCAPVNGNEWVHVVSRRDFGRLDESLVTSLRWCFKAKKEDFSSEEGESAGCRFTMDGTHPLRTMASRFTTRLAQPDVEDESLSTAYRAALIRGEFPEAMVRHASIDSRLQWAALGGPGKRATPDSSVAQRPAYARRLAVNDFSVIGRIPASQKSAPSMAASGPSYASLLPYSYQLNSLQVAARSGQLYLDDPTTLVDLLRQFDDDVMAVEVASFSGLRPAIYVKHRQLGVAPLSIFGDAMRRCLLLATTMTSLGKGGVLLLDEIESGIHVDSLPKVLKWLADVARQVGVQVFATTHSLEVLDALLAAEVGEEDLAAYQIKQGDERTECRRFSFESLKRLRYERGLDIR